MQSKLCFLYIKFYLLLLFWHKNTHYKFEMEMI